MYFNTVKLGDEIFSLIYGKGIATFVLNDIARVTGFYMMKVQYEKCSVMYTEDGLPDWGRDKVQTAFYVKDINLNNIHFEPQDKPLSKKQLHKYMDKAILEMRCPSGIWRNINECPSKIVQKGLSDLSYHLFRKEQ